MPDTLPRLRFVGRRAWDRAWRFEPPAGDFPGAIHPPPPHVRRRPPTARQRTLQDRRERNCPHAHTDWGYTDWESGERAGSCRDCGMRWD